MKKWSNIEIDKMIKELWKISFAVSVIFIPFLFIFYDKIYLFISKYKIAFSYIAAVGAFYTISFSAYQTWMTKRQHYSNFDKEKVLKSIDLAERYKLILDSDIFYLLRVLKELGVTNEYNSFSYTDFKKFTSKEMNQKFKEHQIATLERLQRKLDFNDSEMEILVRQYYDNKNRMIEFYNSPIVQYLALKRKIGKDSLKGEVRKEDQANLLKLEGYYSLESDLIRSDFNNRIYSALNNLEWFAMNFKNGIANDSLLYQSLHQSYLEFIRLMYYVISSMNSDPKSKYFTNVIWLYLYWSDKYDEKCKQEDEHEAKLTTESEGVNI